MPKWFRKTLIVLITVFTFGLVTPPEYLYVDDAKADKHHKAGYIKENIPISTYEQYYELPTEESKYENAESFVLFAMEEAEKQSIEKFGAKITPVIEDEFKEIVLPQIETVLVNLANERKETINNLEISEHPAAGYGEKIFHVYDRESGQDLIRFHVRRENPPKEGYWFNFHYHKADDNFHKHYELGKIYWNRNMPPKWMS
ncbi:YpjP family protein [Bacillus sp. CGMCC 1.16541]|uniref:YpjP family protein n=1 Tax=Bacillus sp. CGMCC 1.16541 TaxID=2185143 RepID=UPI000D73580A|nr:YpjP family protein [Bacillus sp. CGMCC 1.16541]